jgi:hypothetical protein
MTKVPSPMIKNLQIQTLYEDPLTVVGKNKGGKAFKEIVSVQIAFVNAKRSKP